MHILASLAIFAAAICAVLNADDPLTAAIILFGSAAAAYHFRPSRPKPPRPMKYPARRFELTNYIQPPGNRRPKPGAHFIGLR